MASAAVSGGSFAFVKTSPKFAEWESLQAQAMEINMSSYKRYYIENLRNKDNYQKFIEYLVNNSEYFSMIYFNEGKKKTESIRMIHEELKPFRCSRKQVTEWPGTVTMDTRNTYHMELYRIEEQNIPAILKIFNKVDNMLEWDYPAYPMDLSFYKKGYAWFDSCTHEDLFRLTLDRESRLSFFSFVTDTSIEVFDDWIEMSKEKLFFLDMKF